MATTAKNTGHRVEKARVFSAKRDAITLSTGFSIDAAAAAGIIEDTNDDEDVHGSNLDAECGTTGHGNKRKQN